MHSNSSNKDYMRMSNMCVLGSRCAAENTPLFLTSLQVAGLFGSAGFASCAMPSRFRIQSLQPVLFRLYGRPLSLVRPPEATPGYMEGNLKEGGRSSLRGMSGASRLRPSVRPKQSLGQNFLVDLNVIRKIVDAVPVPEHDETGRSVVEVGPGMGALTVPLREKFPDMVAVEIDNRAVKHLNTSCPGLEVIHGNVLDVNWREMYRERGAKPLTVVGNLPYNVVSQIVFSLLESPGSVGTALLMMQKEVAERIVAKIRTKAFGILSVISQLYSKPKILFTVPNTVFYPKPDVTSAMVQFDFVQHPELDMDNNVLTVGLRRVVRQAFQQRRKKLRNSLKALLIDNKSLVFPDEWASKRPEELTPIEFLNLTKCIYRVSLKEFSEMKTVLRDEARERRGELELGAVSVWRTRGNHHFRNRKELTPKA